MTFYGGPLHGQLMRCDDPSVHWISAERLDDDRSVTVEYLRAAPWWVTTADADLAAVYVCASWVAADGTTRSRHGHHY